MKTKGTKMLERLAKHHRYFAVSVDAPIRSTRLRRAVRRVRPSLRDAAKAIAIAADQLSPQERITLKNAVRLSAKKSAH